VPSARRRAQAGASACGGRCRATACSREREHGTRAHGKFLLITNLSETHPGGGLRGPHLYLWKKRGVFQTTVSRHYGPGNTVPSSPIASELKLTVEDITEIEYRFEALKPYLKPGPPRLAPGPGRDGR